MHLWILHYDLKLVSVLFPSNLSDARDLELDFQILTLKKRFLLILGCFHGKLACFDGQTIEVELSNHLLL